MPTQALLFIYFFILLFIYFQISIHCCPTLCLCSRTRTVESWCCAYTVSLSLFCFSCRAFRGKHITLIVRFPNQGRQVDDLDIWSHTNDTIGSVRRAILNRIKANAAHTKIELFIGGEVVDPADDRKLIGQLNLKDKTVRLCAFLSSGIQESFFQP